MSAPEKDPVEAAWANLLRAMTGFSLEAAIPIAVALVSEPKGELRRNQCSLVAASTVINKSAFRSSLALFPDLPFRKAVEGAISKSSGGGEMNFSALNVVGWLVLSSGVDLRPGVKDYLVKKAGAANWADATFVGFSQTPKVPGQLSGAAVAKTRRDSYGTEAIRKAVEVVAATASKGV
jgi:hypothetical protein